MTEHTMTEHASPVLIDWLKDAYGMETGLVPMLEHQVTDTKNHPEMQKRIADHLQQTRRHVGLLRGCLERMGEAVSAIQPSANMFARYGKTNGGGQEEILRDEMIDFVTENFEVASYTALGALARKAGDHETARVADEILHDEREMVQWLERNVSESRDTSMPKADVAQVARDNFDALNAHDLNRWAQIAADDYRGEGPGASTPMDKNGNRDYLQNYLTAFPDLHFDITREIAQGNLVVVDWSSTGTHTGALRGPDGRTAAPTHKKAKVFGSTTFEVKNGKIRRAWVYFDMSALVQQLGLEPKA